MGEACVRLGGEHRGGSPSRGSRRKSAFLRRMLCFNGSFEHRVERELHCITDVPDVERKGMKDGRKKKMMMMMMLMLIMMMMMMMMMMNLPRSKTHRAS
jgi:hypothetical protein